MYSGEAPPSLSSAAIRSFDQEPLNVGAVMVDSQLFGGQNNPSWSNVRSVDNPLAGTQIQANGDINDQPPSYTGFGHGQGNSHNQFQDGVVNRGLGQTAGFVDAGQGPSFTAMGHGQGISSLNQYQDGTFNRGLGQADGFVDSGEAPSIDAMVRAVVSVPSGSGDPNSDGLPPSLKDVAKREASQPGASSTDTQIFDPQAFAGMSLVGTNFRKFYPMAYHKEKDED